jgi:polysaccharide deacetylase 2 family uncharacterized protein YibQ
VREGASAIRVRVARFLKSRKIATRTSLLAFSCSRVGFSLSHFSTCLLLLLIFSSTGCQKPEKPLSVTKIHALTREFAAAAKSAVPTGSEVRTESRSADGSDHLDIGIFSRNADAAGADSARVLQALNAVAVPAGLTQDAESRNEEGISIVYRRSGSPTHSIFLHFAAHPAAIANGRPRQPGANPGQPKLAILLDDLGSDQATAEEIFSLHYPLTISVLPGHAHSAEIANEASHRGYEVMLHLPMQSVGKEQPEAQELRPGMAAAQVSALLEQFLVELPGVTGVNNHQGSQATADQALMSELMPALREHGLFYVDSRTTAATVAYDVARQDGVAAAYRNVPFLDDVEDVVAIEKQLELALHGAREKGEAVAIGHPHPATLRALEEMLPRAQAAGIRFVFVSELVH